METDDARILVIAMKRHDAQKKMKEARGDAEENKIAFRRYRSYDQQLADACEVKLKTGKS